MAGPLLGSAQPRLFTPPLRPLTPSTSLGFEANAYAEHVMGLRLFPWQKVANIRTLELHPRTGRLRFRTSCTLVARQNGKSKGVLVPRTLWRLHTGRAPLVLHAAQDRDTARDAWELGVAQALEAPLVEQDLCKPERSNGREQLRFTHGARWKVVAPNGGGRGKSGSAAIDELREYRDLVAWSALSKVTMAQDEGLLDLFSNAGDLRSVVLNGFRDRGRLAAAADPDEDETLCWLEWSAPDGCDLEDPAGHVAANPSLGHPGGITQAAILDALANDPPAVFRTEVLCQWVDSLDEALDLRAWAQLVDARPLVDRAGLVWGLDMAPTRTSITLGGFDGTGSEREAVELVRSWETEATAYADTLELAGRRPNLRAIAYDPGSPVAPLAQRLADAGLPMEPVKAAERPAACMSMADAVAARRITHPGDPRLDAHVAAATRAPAGDGGFYFARRASDAPIDALYAVTLARWVALRLPPPPPAPVVLVASPKAGTR